MSEATTVGDPHDWTAVRNWRKAQRARSIELRERTAAPVRKSWNEEITRQLLAAFPPLPGTVIGYCWPYRGEFDARFAIREWRKGGATAALPEVVARDAPLVFRQWWPGVSMRRGVYDIPVPADTEAVVPDMALVPMNAFDERGYRLGYGGGFFDRTLQACGGRIVAIGVSYEILRLPTIYPQPHDISMDFVVTEVGVYAADGHGLQRMTADACRVRFAALLDARGLPRAKGRGSGYSSPACYAAEFPDYFRGTGEDPA